MTRPRPPRLAPLDRELAEAIAEAEELSKRNKLAAIRASNARWWDRHKTQPYDPRF